MAGFSLGGSHHQYPPNEIPTETLFAYRNEEISPFNTHKGFELWHPQHQQQQHHQPDAEIYSSSALGVRTVDGSDELSSRAVTMLMRQGGSSSVSCQDCGNQAKKDCEHIRCRTCCKSRGFQCQTHVNSTWVSASRRRERKQQEQLAASSLHHHQQQGQEEVEILAENTKRPRVNLAAPASTRLITAASSGSFPAEVNIPAVFRCVRVSSIDDSEDQYAYRTAVSIGGHVFKGVLYDQGPEITHHYADHSSSGTDGARNLIMAADTNPSTATNTLNAFVAGTQFFTRHRS